MRCAAILIGAAGVAVAIYAQFGVPIGYDAAPLASLGVSIGVFGAILALIDRARG